MVSQSDDWSKSPVKG